MLVVHYQKSFTFWSPKLIEKGIILRFMNWLYPDRKPVSHPSSRSVVGINQNIAETVHVGIMVAVHLQLQVELSFHQLTMKEKGNVGTFVISSL